MGPLLPPIAPSGSDFPVFQPGNVNSAQLQGQLAPANLQLMGAVQNPANPTMQSVGIGRLNEAQQQQDSLYNAVLSGHDTRVSDIIGRNQAMANATRQQQAAGLAEIGNQWRDARTEALESYGGGQAGTLARLQSGYANLDSAFGHRLPQYQNSQLGVQGQHNLRAINAANDQANVDAQQSLAEMGVSTEQSDLDSRYSRRSRDIADLLAQRGAAQRADIDANFDRQRKDAVDSAVSRGLGNTTVLDSTHRGIEVDRNREQQRLSDSLRDSEIERLASTVGEELQSAGQGVDRRWTARRAGVEDRQGYRDLRSQQQADRIAAYDNQSNMEAQLRAEEVGQRAGSLAAELGQMNDNRREQQQIDTGFRFPYLSFLETGLGNQVTLGEDQRSADISLASALTGDRLGYQGSRVFDAPSLGDMFNFSLQAESQTPQAVGTSRSSNPFGYNYATPNSSRLYTNQGRQFSTNIGQGAAAGVAQRAFNEASIPSWVPRGWGGRPLG